jgi:hypothetical protein
MVSQPGSPAYTLEIPEGDPKAEDVGTPGDPSHTRRYTKEVTTKKRVRGRMTDVKEKVTLATHGFQVTPEIADDLKAAGFTEVQVYVPKYWDLVCEELCGAGHTKMQGKLVVLEPAEWNRRFGRPTGPTTAPAPVVASRGQE